MTDEDIIKIIEAIDWNKESAFDELIERIKKNENI